MINLDKLNSQFDLKSIDISQYTKLLLEHQKYVKLAFLVGSLLMVWGMFNDHHTKDQRLQAQMSQEQAKLAVIKARDAAIGDLNTFKSSIPKEMNVFDVVTLITNDAKAYNTVIVSYIPNQTRDAGLYDDIDVRFDLMSSDFKNMMLFLRKIEKSKSPLKVNSWSGHAGDDGKITFTIEISAVLIHP